jgi:hypothetical protein
VTVVVPCYNGAATLGATLASATSQTHENLEVIVVDDGSTDRTAEIARAAAAQDARIRLIRVPNGGVARARNVGAAEGRGAWIAPLDQDDLWHPTWIARQLEVMREGGPGMGFVYAHSRRIDAEGRILYDCNPWAVSGRIYLRQLLMNFVGNGSALLIRRSAFEAVGGYSPALRGRGIDGADDYLMQILLARHFAVGVAPEYLFGYRVTPGGMSRNRRRLNESIKAVLEETARRFPETPPDLLAEAEAVWRARSATALLVNARRPGDTARQLGRALRAAPLSGAGVFGHEGWLRTRGLLAARIGPPQAPGGPFLAADPKCGLRAPRWSPLAGRLRALAARDAAFAGLPPGSAPPARRSVNTGSAGVNAAEKSP